MKLGFIGAMDVEVAALKEKMEGASVSVRREWSSVRALWKDCPP